MAEEAYFLDGSRNQQGPVPVAEIARLIRNGTIRRDTLVWYPGMPDWRPASQVNEFASLFGQAGPPPRPPAASSPPPFSGAAPMQRTGPMAGGYPGQAQQFQAPQYDAGGRMGFGRAITTCFRKYVDFTGRASRPEYWFWILFNVLVVIGMLIIDMIIFSPEDGIFPLMWLASLALLLPTLAVGVRRLHDQDYSGWMILIYFIPLVGWIIFFVLMCLRGTAGPNRFGPVPGAASMVEEFS